MILLSLVTLCICGSLMDYFLDVSKKEISNNKLGYSRQDDNEEDKIRPFQSDVLLTKTSNCMYITEMPSENITPSFTDVVPTHKSQSKYSLRN